MKTEKEIKERIKKLEELVLECKKKDLQEVFKVVYNELQGLKWVLE